MTVDFKEYSRRMDKALEHLDEEFASVRAGRANAKVLDRITVEYYGSETPLNGVATISAPDARTLIIQPWDTKLLKDIQKAIQTSDLGINPQNDGRVIRLVFPQLTEERRRTPAKQVQEVFRGSGRRCCHAATSRDGIGTINKLEKGQEDHRGRPEESREGFAGSAGQEHQARRRRSCRQGKGTDGDLTPSAKTKHPCWRLEAAASRNCFFIFADLFTNHLERGALWHFRKTLPRPGILP